MLRQILKWIFILLHHHLHQHKESLMLLHHAFLLRTVNISHYPPTITSSLTYPAFNREVVKVEYDQQSRWYNNSNHPTLYSISFSKLCLNHVPCNMPTLHYIKHKDLEKTFLNNFLTVCNWIWKQLTPSIPKKIAGVTTLARILSGKMYKTGEKHWHR